MPSADTFLAALCHPAASRTLKIEAGRAGLSNAFEKKGEPTLVTFKSPTPLTLDAAVPAVFALHQGLSLGALDDATLLAFARAQKAPPCLQVLGEPEAIAGLLETGAFHGDAPRFGEPVVTVLDLPGLRWTTLHRHRSGLSPHPAQRPPLVLPEDAPSRAWLKIEEAIARFELDPQPGERALEIGAAPGGASSALLTRGLSVTGVDPNAIDERLLRNPRFLAVPQTSFAVPPDAVRGPFHWLLLDVNVPPGTALRGALPHVAQHLKTLRGLVLTLKLPTWEAVTEEIEGWLRRVRRALPGFDVEARQLWFGGQEICVVARRRPRGRA